MEYGYYVYSDAQGLHVLGGGNSLIAVRLHQQLQQQGHTLKLTDLFHYPTIALLAEHLQSMQQRSPDRTLPHKPARTSASHRQRRRRARHHHDPQR